MYIRRRFAIQLRIARRLAVAAAGLALAGGVLPVVGGVVSGTTGAALADDTMASVNTLRNGWDSSEPLINPTTVPSFTQQWTNSGLGESANGQAVSGAVYAQPLVVGSTVIVATENDVVYGLDAGTGAVKWKTTLGNPFAITKDSAFNGCTDLIPNIGITGAPAYDPNTGHIFFFANIITSNNPAYFMVEMDLSGNVVHKIPITGKPSNDSSIGFSARYNMERPGVLVLNGNVYAAFASHCDHKPYSGYVVRVNIPSLSTTTPKMTLWTDEATPTNDQAGIWQSGGGVMADPQGRIFVTSGNGVSPPNGAGTSPGKQLAESVIRIADNGSTLSAQDFFSPANAPSLDASDTDFGAGAPVGVQFPVGSFSNTLAQVGKDGRMWLLNRDKLGGRSSTDSGSLFVTKAYGGEWGHPAIFGDQAVTRANSATPLDNNFAFNVGKDDVLRVFRFFVASSGKVGLTNLANSTTSFGFTSGSPVVTSNGDDPTSAVIWATETPNTKATPDPTGVNSVLEAYSLGNVASTGGHPSPCLSTSPCKLTNIWHSQKFTAAKFSIVATSQGWVYVGTRDGHVLAFAKSGTPAPHAGILRTGAPLAHTAVVMASATTFPQTKVGATSTAGVTVTATKNVTITGATVSTDVSTVGIPTSEFGAGQTTFPITLKAGDKVTIPTTFTPTAPGGSSGTLTLSTDSTAFPTVDVPLIGEGTQEGIYAQPASQDFPWEPDHGVVPVPVGIQKPEIVTISNLGNVTQTITKVTPPSAPFTASNLPAVGSKLVPGASIAVQVTFSPKSAGTATGSFTIAGSSGQKAVVTLTAVGTAAVSQLTPTVVPPGTAPAAASHAATGTPITLDLGSIAVGKTATGDINVSNTGNTATLLAGASNLHAPFAAPIKPRAGLPFNPDSDLQIPVTFTPTHTGTFSATYRLRWRDVNGRHTLVVTITGTGV